MTRLADALERAQSRGIDISTGGRLVPPPPEKSTASPEPPPQRSVAAAEPVPGAFPSLIAPPSQVDQMTAWRTDPALVGKLLGTEGFSSGAQEQYRKLGASLHYTQTERGIKVIMTASALPGEGKSLTVVNLALTLSESYQRRVFLIDADLRRPSIQRMFGLPPISGLNEGLKSERERPMPITQISSRLFVLAAGRPDPDPMSGLTSPRLRRLVEQASGAFDWVLIDTPPVGLLPDAHLLESCVDAVLLVVRSGKAPYSLVKRTVETVGRERILGVVMNAVDFSQDRNAGGYYEYYGYGYYGTPPGK